MTLLITLTETSRNDTFDQFLNPGITPGTPTQGRYNGENSTEQSEREMPRVVARKRRRKSTLRRVAALLLNSGITLRKRGPGSRETDRSDEQ